MARAQAQPPPSEPSSDFTRLVNQGLEHYQQGRYEDAITSFRSALTIKPDPKLLYNIARSYEKLGKIDESIDTYQKFVDAPGTTAQERSKALEQIKALKAEKAARDAATRQPSETPPNPTATPGGATGAQTRASTRVETHPPVPEKSHVVEYALIGVGVAGIAVGAIFGGLALSEKSSYDSATTEADKRSHRDSGNRDAVISDVGIIGGIGIAAIGAGIWLVSSRDDSTVAFVPAIGPDRVGAAFAAHF